jgi:Rod binding domain-containing protein
VSPIHATGRAPVPAAQAAAPTALRRTAQDLEAVFVGQLLRAMPFSFGAGDAQPFADLLVDELGKLVARQGGIGIAAAVARQVETLEGGR